MKNLITIFLWITHWAIQGLKLWLFGTLALLAAFSASLPFGLLDAGIKKFIPPSPFTEVASGAVGILCILVALAVGAAVFASVINDHPLRSFVQRRRTRQTPINPNTTAQTTASPSSGL